MTTTSTRFLPVEPGTDLTAFDPQFYRWQATRNPSGAAGLHQGGRHLSPVTMVTSADLL